MTPLNRLDEDADSMRDEIMKRLTLADKRVYEQLLKEALQEKHKQVKTTRESVLMQLTGKNTPCGLLPWQPTEDHCVRNSSKPLERRQQPLHSYTRLSRLDRRERALLSKDLQPRCDIRPQHVISHIRDAERRAPRGPS